MYRRPLFRLSISFVPNSQTATFFRSFTTHKTNLPLPHRTIPEPKGQDLDFINVAYSHLVHSDWLNLDMSANFLTPFRVKQILLKVQKDYVLSLEFFKWVETKRPDCHTLESYAFLLHILTKYGKFKSAESILKKILQPGLLDLPAKLFESILHSYRLCDSSPSVFDNLFKTSVHLRKLRNATDTFLRMKEYGFLPTVESCNAFMSAAIDLDRVDIVLGFYRELRRRRVSVNIYTFNIIIHAYCKLGKVDKAIDVLREVENLGFTPTVASYNTLIAGYCQKGLINAAMKLKILMMKNGVHPNVVTFNTIINGLCKEGKLNEAYKTFHDMKSVDVVPDIVTYNTLINGYGQVGNGDMGHKVFDEMSRRGVEANILTYNGVILGLCKEGKTKKAANLIKELDKKNLTPNSSTYAALICGECVRKNPNRAFQLYKIMVRNGCHPNDRTFRILINAFCGTGDFDGATEVLREMFERLIKPDQNAVLKICNGLRREGKDELLLRLCNELEARNLIPEGLGRDEIVKWIPG